MPTTIEEVFAFCYVLFILLFVLFIFGLVIFSKLCDHLQEHENVKKEKELIAKTRAVVFDEICEYFESAERSCFNESECKKR